MTSLDWFEIGVDTGLVAAWIVVRPGRRQRGQPTGKQPRTFADGVRQLCDQLDREKERPDA